MIRWMLDVDVTTFFLSFSLLKFQTLLTSLQQNKRPTTTDLLQVPSIKMCIRERKINQQYAFAFSFALSDLFSQSTQCSSSLQLHCPEKERR